MILTERMPVRHTYEIVRRFAAFVLIVLMLYGCDTGRQETVRTESGESAGRSCSRIVSLAPSITETLYALGLGDRIVGVTQFCLYPPEAAEKQSVGGYLDPNYEMMASLKPDLVLLLPEHESVRRYLDQLDIHHVTVHNRTVDEIMETIAAIGGLCGVKDRADSIAADIEDRMETLRSVLPQDKRPRVLISIGRTMGTGTLKDVYVAGIGTFYDELISFAGGRNAYNGDTIAYPLLSAEGLLHLNPDIIMDLVPDFNEKGHSREAILDEWRSVGKVRAVKDSRVFLLTGSYTVIPGPRFILLLEDMANTIRTDTGAP